MFENGSSDIKISGEATDGMELLRLLKSSHPDLVLLDLSMPGKHGLEVIKDIHNEYPELPVLVLSMHPEERFAVRVLKAGAVGYLTKNTQAELIMKAIRQIAIDNKKYISPAVAELIAGQMDETRNGPLYEKLSDREYQVLRLIARGQDVDEIAGTLDLHPRTIHMYRSNILEKLELDTNVDLVHYARDQHLID